MGGGPSSATTKPELGRAVPARPSSQGSFLVAGIAVSCFLPGMVLTFLVWWKAGRLHLHPEGPLLLPRLHGESRLDVVPVTEKHMGLDGPSVPATSLLFLPQLPPQPLARGCPSSAGPTSRHFQVLSLSSPPSEHSPVVGPCIRATSLGSVPAPGSGSRAVLSSVVVAKHVWSWKVVTNSFQGQ